MDGKMWFGNRAYMQWIKCPEVGGDYGMEGYSVSQPYMNGGIFRRQTLSAAKTFQLSWPLTSRDNVRPIKDYAEGVYGDLPIYWSDPFTMDQNVLAQSFATPSLGGHDGTVLNGSDERPQLVQTSANSWGYPAESAIYTLNATTDTPFRHWIPIPPGYTAWVGVHGVAGAGKVYARTTQGVNAFGSATELTMLPVTTSTRFADSFAASSTVEGIEIWLGGTGTITLSGIMVQVLKTGTTPAIGGFISGQGHSGCTWNGHPTMNAYSAAMDYVGLTASLIETEQWR